MSHQATLHVLAIIFLVCVVFVAVVDAGVEFGVKPAIRVKWTLPWVMARYIAVISGTLLSLDVVF